MTTKEGATMAQENVCENCKHENTCTKTIGIMFGYCNIDFEAKEKERR